MQYFHYSIDVIEIFYYLKKVFCFIGIVRIFDISKQTKKDMTYLKNTAENKAKMEALKKVKETQWVGEVGLIA